MPNSSSADRTHSSSKHGVERGLRLTDEASLQQILAAIGPAGATPDQLAAANADITTLAQQATTPTTAVTAAQQQFAGFIAKQSGPGSIQAAIDGFGQCHVNAVEHLQSSPLTR